jgi:LysM repeat protein
MHPRPKILLPAAALVLVIGASVQAVQPAEANDRSIVVQAGDTLGGIALRTGIPVETLARINGIDDPDHIIVGQHLNLEPAAAPTTGITHTVAPGETLSGIALRYGTTVAEIARANGITNPSYLQVGAVLRLPGVPPSAGAPDSMADRMAARAGIRALIENEARRQGVPVAFALAVAWQESGWQQGPVSGAGAIGVMQLLPATGDWVSGSMLGEAVDLHDAASNVRAGVALLRFYLDRYAGSRDLALAAYYQGMTAADRHGVYAVSRPYIASILALEAILSR